MVKHPFSVLFFCTANLCRPNWAKILIQRMSRSAGVWGIIKLNPNQDVLANMEQFRYDLSYHCLGTVGLELMDRIFLFRKIIHGNFTIPNPVGETFEDNQRIDALIKTSLKKDRLSNILNLSEV